MPGELVPVILFLVPDFYYSINKGPANQNNGATDQDIFEGNFHLRWFLLLLTIFKKVLGIRSWALGISYQMLDFGISLLRYFATFITHQLASSPAHQLKRAHEVTESSGDFIFFRNQRLVSSPVDPKVRVIPCDPHFGFPVIHLGTF